MTQTTRDLTDKFRPRNGEQIKSVVYEEELVGTHPWAMSTNRLKFTAPDDWAISIIFGSGAYASPRVGSDEIPFGTSLEDLWFKLRTVEYAILNPAGDLQKLGVDGFPIAKEHRDPDLYYDEVKGHVPLGEMEEILYTFVNRHQLKGIPTMTLDGPEDLVTELLNDLSEAPTEPGCLPAECESVHPALRLPDLREEHADQLGNYFATASLIKDRSAETGRLYKVTDMQGMANNGGAYAYDLPTQDEDGNWTPGAWTDVIDPVALCSKGYHFTHSPDRWSGDSSYTRIFEIEARGAHLERASSWSSTYDNKGVAKSIRLIREVTEEWRQAMVDQYAEAERERQRQIEEARLRREEEERLRQERIAKNREFFNNLLGWQVEGITDAMHNNKVVVFGTSSEEVVKTILSTMCCPQCQRDPGDWGIEFNETENYTRTTKKEISIYGGRLDTEAHEDDEHDPYNSDRSIKYSCCDYDVESSDFDDMIYIVKGGDWEDNVTSFLDTLYP